MMSQKTLHNLALFIFIGIALIAALLPIRFADTFFLDLWLPILWAVGIGAASCLEKRKGFVMTFLLSLVPVAAGVIYYGVAFASNESFLVAGVIPWSDAYMHFRQAAQMTMEGITTTGMNGRFLYPAYFSSLLTLTGCHLMLAHLFSALFIAVTLTLLLRVTAPVLRLPGAAMIALVVGLFFRAHCSGLVMTENLGLLCGVLSLTLFLVALQRRSFGCLLWGIFIMVLGFSARPGALFILPLLILYLGYLAAYEWKEILPSRLSNLWKAVMMMMLAVIIVIIGFGANTLLSKNIYRGSVITNGNFSFTLYGMLTEGKWSDAATSFHWNAQQAMQESIHLIKEKPFLLVKGAFRAYKEAIARRVFFMFEHEDRLATSLLLLAVVGIIAAWKIKELKPYALWGTVMTAGILLSVPFIPAWDAAERPLAVTIPFQGFLAGMGLFAIGHYFFFKHEVKKPTAKISIKPIITCSLLLLFLSVLMPIAHCYFLENKKQQPSSDIVVMRPGAFLTLTPENSPAIHQRMAFFLLHNPEQRFLFHLLNNQSIVAINWKNKNLERSIFLPSPLEMVNINGWKVDKRLLSAVSNQ